MKIIEIEQFISAEQALQLEPIFTEAFGTPPSESFLERLNEKKDLLVLLAYFEDELVGFKIGYTRFKGIFFSWLGAVAKKHRRKGIARELTIHQHNSCVGKMYEEIQTESASKNRGMTILNLQEGFEPYGFLMGHQDTPTLQLRKRLGKTEAKQSVLTTPEAAPPAS